jgi:DNA-binding Lrp family transcriptional regulator
MRSSSPIEFSVNQVARELGIMPFTVHRGIRTLEYDGIIRARGLRTKKRFYLAEPKALLIRWLRHYQFQRKNKLWKFALSDPKKFETQREQFFNSFAVPALHNAAQSIFRAGNTNILLIEGYLLEAKTVGMVASKFGLVEQERGYEVLLIKSYYQRVVERYFNNPNDMIWKQAFAVLTFLDLYFFPIRGREQAEVLFRKVPALKSLGAWAEFESIESL